MRKSNWKHLNLYDDFVFKHVMENPLCLKATLEFLLNHPIESLVLHNGEQQQKNFIDSRGTRLDVFAKTSTSIYDIEMQNYRIPYLGKRSRYYQSVMDVTELQQGTEPCDLLNNISIFICTFDPFGLGLPMYTFREKCDENGNATLNSGIVKIFLNTANCKGTPMTPLEEFLHFVEHTIPDVTHSNKLIRILSEQIIHIRTDTRLEAEYMTLEDLIHDREEYARKEALEQGLEQGETAGAQKVALRLYEKGSSPEFIYDVTGITPEDQMVLRENSHPYHIE